MSTLLTIEVKNAKEIFELIGDHRKRDLDEPSRNILKALADDYQLWFNEIENDWKKPSKRSTVQRAGVSWEDGEPQWLVGIDYDGTVLAYASVLVPQWAVIGQTPGKLLDVCINESVNPLPIIPKIRTAVNDLFWYHASKPRPKKS